MHVVVQVTSSHISKPEMAQHKLIKASEFFTPVIICQSVSCIFCCSSFVTGTAGINHVPPLRLYDTNSAQMVTALGAGYRFGAGVLDVQYEDPHILLSCGYDTLVRMWDIRASHTHWYVYFSYIIIYVVVQF